MACLRMNKKDEYPSVWAPGVVSSTLGEVIATFGVTTLNRRRKAEKLHCLEQSLVDCGISATMWLCGSFLTSKPDPDDLDAVLWPRGYMWSAEDAECARMVLNHKCLRENYGVDCHIEALSREDAFDREAHWLGFYGFGWDRRTPRTIVEIQIGSK